jgi:hypothetical protein
MSILEIAEAADSYRMKCSQSFLNQKARELQDYELSSISKYAQMYLEKAINTIPLYDVCQIAILNDNADNGFPHTRPNNIVCLPASICIDEPATPKFIETLIHEAIHVHQRLNKELWLKSLKRVKWTPVNSDLIPDEFKQRMRLNPDTILEPFWAWSEYHVPLCLFRKTGEVSLSNTIVEWLDLRTDSLFHDPPKGFNEVYKHHRHQMEHTYEIYAEIFAAKQLKSNEDLENALSKL